MSGRTTPSATHGYDSFEVRLGDELRGERATLSKSLLDVQRDLRIKAAYIAAIENCDTSVFQNKGFVAGYVRSYARYLNLEAETIYTRFCQEAGFGGVNEGMTPKPKLAGKTRAKAKRIEKNTLIHPALRNPVRKTWLSGTSASGLGSVAVLLLLMTGLGFGAWSVLQDIQRVQLVPVDQTPGAIATIETPVLAEAAIAETSSPAGQTALPSDLLYARVYRPQELAVPELDHRDGPIAGIDPREMGVFARSPAVEQTEIAALVQQAAAEQDSLRDPRLVESLAPPTVSVFATSPAWVRVYLADGSRVFEKILETGESYVLPADIHAALLRAGNAGAVFVSVDEVAYGPVGDGTAVAKEISLAVADVQARWPVAAEQSEMAIRAVASAMTENALASAPVAAIIPASVSPDDTALVPASN